MQCNAMQCNVNTEVRPSVRNEVSQSFFYFFFIFRPVRNGNVSMYGTQSSDDRQHIFCQNEMSMDGQTIFQFSFSSVAYSQLPVPYGGPKKKKKKNMLQTNTQNTDPIGGNTFN
jgi:hypothetical protein